MKRLSIILVALCATLMASAVELPMAVGVTHNYASEYNQHGLGVKLQAGLPHNLRLEPELIYSFERKDVSTLHVNLNLHYVVPVASSFNLYPFVGLSYSHWNYIGPDDDHVGVNLGAGLEYDLGNDWSILGELRYQAIRSESQAITSIGVKYNF